MLIDGRAIAEEIMTKLARVVSDFSAPPSLAIVIVGDDSVIESFVRIKKKVATKLGVPVIERRFSTSMQGTELLHAISELGKNTAIDGIIIQLPLPPPINTQIILDAVPAEKDVDMLSTESVAAFRRGDAIALPPIAGAIQEILERNNVTVAGKEALVLGYGRLVGVPAALFLRHNGAHATVVDKPIPNIAEHVRESDIVICGIGNPGFLRKEWLKKDAVVIDAGTSEAGGKIVGDAEPKCAEVASIFTPVPGGVGPIAVAMIFKNLLILASSRVQKPQR